MLPVLVFILTVPATFTQKNTCQLQDADKCCQECDAKEMFCQAKSDSISEATDCLKYQSRCKQICSHRKPELPLANSQQQQEKLPLQ